jgi:phage tail-like protein
LDGAGRLVPTADPVAVPAGGDPPVLTPPPLVPSGDGFTWRDPALPGRRPMRIGGLAVTPDGRHQDTLLPLLALPRRVEVPRFGSFTTTALDSGRTAFAWDRITLEAVLPPQGRLVVSTLTSEVEVAFDRLATLPAQRWSAPLAVGPGDVPEVLIQSRPGRYLWIKVELSGDGTASPVVSQLDVFGPRRSATRYLPASFHQDPESVRFLDRFLSYFDTVYAEITAVNGEIATLFDPAMVPQEFLAWLGSWFDLEFLASWPEQVRRTMIAEAIGYYRMRGTVAGLKRILQWHTGLSDPLPQVIEHFRLPGGPVLIGGAELDVGTPAHAFTIVLPEHVASAGARTVLERLIASNIPAHTRYRLCLVRPGVTVAAQSTIGVDMTLPLRGGAPLGVAGLGTTFTTAPAEPGGAVHLPLQLGSRRQLCPPQPDGGPSC